MTWAGVLAVSFLAAAVLGWAIALRERGHRPIAVLFSALAAAWAADAIASALGERGLETMRIAIASLGVWAVARVIMERRSAVVPVAIAALLAIGSAIPALAELRAASHQGAWALGTLGAMVSIGGAMRRGDEPTVSHLVVLGLTALGAAQIVIGHTEGATGLVPSAAGAGAAVLAQALWLGLTRWWKADDARPEQLRADRRVGDLVDLEAALRGRAAGDGRSAGGRVEP
jgi:hypothetical protein